MREFKKAVAIALSVLMLFSVAMVAASAEEVTGNTVVLDATNGGDGLEWYAWTWGTSNGQWIVGNGTSAADITFTDIEDNVIFASFPWGNGTPSTTWENKIAQTGNLTIDGTLFTVSGVEEGTVYGEWSTPATSEENTSEAATSEADTSEADTSEVATSEADTSEVATSEADTSEVATSEADTSEVATSEADTSEAEASEAAASDTTPDPEGELSNFYVTGSAGLCGAEWANAADENTQMTFTTDETYVKVFRNVAAGTYNFKVIEVAEGGAVTWHPDGMGNDSAVTVDVDGSTVVVTLVPTGNASNDKAEAEVTFAPAAPATSEEASSEVATSEADTSEVATSEGTTSEADTSETATSEGTTSEADTSEVATSETTTSETATSEAATSETATSETATSETATSEAGTSEAAPATTVTVKAAKTQIAYPATTTVKATVENGVGATKFATSNKKVAIVNKTTGKVRAKGVGTAKITATNNGVKATVTIKVVKGANPMKVSAKNVSVKVGKSVKAITVTKAKGKVSYKVTKGNKKLTVKAGKITAKKGLKAGKYTVKVKVSAKGNKGYKAGSKTVSVKVTVK